MVWLNIFLEEQTIPEPPPFFAIPVKFDWTGCIGSFQLQCCLYMNMYFI